MFFLFSQHCTVLEKQTGFIRYRLVYTIVDNMSTALMNFTLCWYAQLCWDFQRTLTHPLIYVAPLPNLTVAQVSKATPHIVAMSSLVKPRIYV